MVQQAKQEGDLFTSLPLGPPPSQTLRARETSQNIQRGRTSKTTVDTEHSKSISFCMRLAHSWIQFPDSLAWRGQRRGINLCASTGVRSHQVTARKESHVWIRHRVEARSHGTRWKNGGKESSKKYSSNNSWENTNLVLSLCLPKITAIIFRLFGRNQDPKTHKVSFTEATPPP